MSLLIEYQEDVKIIRLNRPDSLNSFNPQMTSDFIEELNKTALETQTRVVILTGTGRAFSAGADMRATEPFPWVPKEVGPTYANRYSIRGLAQIPRLMRALPQPIVTAVNGAAAGMGYMLALASDLCIAGASAKFVNAFHNASTGCEFGFSYMLPRVVGTQRAAELLLTGRPVLADEAERIGLVLQAVPDAELLAAAMDLCRAIAANSPIDIWLTKEALWTNQSAGSLEAAMELEHRGVLVARTTEDAKEKRSAFLEKRTPKFTLR